MRPANTTTAATATTTDVGFHRWNSPVPYLFGGLAIMMGLIALALVILACSFKQSSSDSSSEVQGQEAGGKAGQVLKPEMEPKIVVIMAGDDHPTYLAKPVASARNTEQV